MKLFRSRRAQSMLEYAILLAIVIAAFLLVQTIVKRALTGGSNEAAERMGNQYSISGTTIKDSRTQQGDYHIKEETGTFAAGPLSQLGVVGPAAGVIDKGAHQYIERNGQNFTSETKIQTEGAKEEKWRWADIQAGPAVADYDMPGF